MPLLPRQRLALETRHARPIENEINRAECDEGRMLAMRDLLRRHPQSRPRTAVPSLAYNCHGLAFAARRTCIGSEQVQQILTEDGYSEIGKADVLPGDIAIYRSPETFEIMHSAMVVQCVEFLTGPLVVSKWGEMHEAIHLLSDCPYHPFNVSFYRMHK